MKKETLEVLVKAHQAEVYRYLRYLGADNEAAEDLVQDSFLEAFRSSKAPELDDVRGRAAWLRAIARNLFLNYCRRRRRSPVRANSEYLEQAESFWVTGFLRGGDGFDYVEALRACLERISQKHRHLLRQRYAEGKSRPEMSRFFKMSENGIKSLLRRIRLTLGECIRRRLGREQS